MKKAMLFLACVALVGLSGCSKKERNTVVGTVIGAAAGAGIGAAAGGPVGAAAGGVTGGLVGGLIGNSTAHDDERNGNHPHQKNMHEHMDK